jgi:carbon monoxide dehydrogenase subunit G
MTELVTGTASITVARPPQEVFAVVSDITRMGEWSPENVGGRWVEGGGPAVGATFVGDNEAKVGPVTVKKWTTTSEVTVCEPGAVFEFVTEGFTTWRFEMSAANGGTRLTESFSCPPTTGVQKVLYNMLGSRRKAIVRGMEKTLAGMKLAAER